MNESRLVIVPPDLLTLSEPLMTIYTQKTKKPWCKNITLHFTLSLKEMKGTGLAPRQRETCTLGSLAALLKTAPFSLHCILVSAELVQLPDLLVGTSHGCYCLCEHVHLLIISGQSRPWQLGSERVTQSFE